MSPMPEPMARRRGRRLALVAIFALLAAALALSLFVWVTEIQRQRQDGALLGADFSLTDHRGQPITQAAIKAGPALLFFGFTHCPDICPTTLVEVDNWLAELGEDAAPLRAFFITVDPERDTPEALGQFIPALSDRVTGISGPPEAVLALVRAWKVYFQRVPDPADATAYSMDHTASVYLLRPGGRFFGLLPYGASSEEALAKLRALLAAG